MSAYTDTYSPMLCREWEGLEHSILCGTFPSNPSPKPRELYGRGGTKSVGTRGDGEYQGNKAFSPTWPEHLRTHRDRGRMHSAPWDEKWILAPIPYQKLSPIDKTIDKWKFSLL